MQAALCCLHTVDVLHVPTYLDQKLWVERRPDPNLFKAQVGGMHFVPDLFWGVSLQILAICTRLCSAVQRNIEQDKSQYLQDLTAICAAINEKLSVKVHQSVPCDFSQKYSFYFGSCTKSSILTRFFPCKKRQTFSQNLIFLIPDLR